MSVLRVPLKVTQPSGRDGSLEPWGSAEASLGMRGGLRGTSLNTAAPLLSALSIWALDRNVSECSSYSVFAFNGYPVALGMGNVDRGWC